MTKDKMSESLWFSYWVGMTPEICGVTSRNLVATTEIQTHVLD